jgi:hypothetical protein
VGGPVSPFRPQGPDDQHRDERARKQVGSDHGEAYGQRQRYEQIASRALHEECGDEHRQNRQHRQKIRDPSRHGPFVRRLAEPRAPPQVGVNILDDDGTLVDEYSYRQRQPAEGHQVDGLSRCPQSDCPGQDRKGNVHHHDQGASPIAKKQQHHQSRENGAESALFGETQNGSRDVRGLVEFVADPHARRNDGLEFRQALLDQAHDAERGSVSALRHRDIDGTAAIHERIARFDVR